MTEKPLLQALRGQRPSRTPVWLMRQAGRYLPEYRALRAKARDFLDLCFSPKLAIEATLQPIKRFGMDGAILFADILLVPHALGQRVRFVEGEGPRLDPIRDAQDLARLSDENFAGTLLPVLETVRGVKAALSPETTLIGFAGAPWTVATYMVEGAGGSDFLHIREMAWQKPQLFAALIDKLVTSTSDYLIAQIRAGAEAVQLFDTWAGAVPASLFDVAVIRPAQAIVKAVKAAHPGTPVIGFPRASAGHIARYAALTGVDAVGVDHMTDLDFAAQAAGRAIVQGNLDPALLLGGGKAMEDEARRILSRMADRNFIFNLGHGVLPPTPPEHVARLVELVRGAV